MQISKRKLDVTVHRNKFLSERSDQLGSIFASGVDSKNLIAEIIQNSQLLYVYVTNASWKQEKEVGIA